MTLSLLLDENISPVVAEQVRRKRSDILIQSVHLWREGAYLSVPDEILLQAAHEDRLTLVTYDKQILSELAYLFEEETAFSGLIFVDEKTMPDHDFGRLVRALIYLWDMENEMDWSGRLIYLPAPNESGLPKRACLR